jgi:hypothetical protein
LALALGLAFVARPSHGISVLFAVALLIFGPIFMVRSLRRSPAEQAETRARMRELLARQLQISDVGHRSSRNQP